MKKLFSLLTAIILIFSFTLSGLAAASDTATFTDKSGISFSYSKQLKLNTEKLDLGIPSVSIISIFTKPSGKVTLNVNVTKETLAKKLTLKQYTDSSIASLKKTMTAAAGFKNLKVTTKKIIKTKNKYDFQALDVTYTLNGIAFKAKQYCMVSGTSAYIVTLTDAAATADKNAALAETMVNSFKIGKATTGETKPAETKATLPKPVAEGTYDKENPAPLNVTQVLKCIQEYNGKYHNADLYITFLDIKTGNDALKIAKDGGIDTSSIKSNMELVAAKVSYGYTNVDTNDVTYISSWYQPVKRIESGDYALIGGTDYFTGGLGKAIASDKLAKGDTKIYTGWVLYPIMKGETANKVGFMGDRENGQDEKGIWFKLSK